MRNVVEAGAAEAADGTTSATATASVAIAERSMSFIRSSFRSVVRGPYPCVSKTTLFLVLLREPLPPATGSVRRNGELSKRRCGNARRHRGYGQDDPNRHPGAPRPFAVEQVALDRDHRPRRHLDPGRAGGDARRLDRRRAHRQVDPRVDDF